MITESNTLKSKAIFSDDKKHRILLRKTWDDEKPSAMVIMINPNSADELSFDMTTMLVMNNLHKLGYGSVDVVNLYTRIAGKIHFRFNSDDDLLHPDNDDVIYRSAEKSDTIIIGWGTVGLHNMRIRERQNAVLDMLKAFSNKICQISENGCHPLTPAIRNHWDLVPYEMEENND